jgi:hypothetical protein
LRATGFRPRDHGARPRWRWRGQPISHPSKTHLARGAARGGMSLWGSLLALALLPLLASSYNTNQLVILTPEELKPMILRVSHPESSCFTSEMQAAMPHALNPKATEKAELILEKLVRVSCGKHKCARPQPIWWIEEHVKVVQLLAKMRKSSACPLFCFIAGNPGHMSTGRYIVAGRVWWSGAVWCCPLQRSYRARRAAAASGSSSSSPRSGRCCRRRRRARTAASRKQVEAGGQPGHRRGALPQRTHRVQQGAHLRLPVRPSSARNSHSPASPVTLPPQRRSKPTPKCSRRCGNAGHTRAPRTQTDLCVGASLWWRQPGRSRRQNLIETLRRGGALQR